MRRHLLTGIIAAVAATAASTSMAAVITASADATVRNGSSNAEANLNFGASLLLELKNDSLDGDNYKRKAWLRFDVTDVTGAVSGATHTFSVTFDSYSAATSTARTVRVFALKSGFAAPGGVLDAAWAEGAGNGTNTPDVDITWGNAPGNAAGNALDSASLNEIGSFSVPGNTATGTDFSVAFAGLDSYVNTVGGRKYVTFILTQDVLRAQQILNFRSKEATSTVSTDAPRLDVAVPEPAIAGTAMLGIAALWMRRRR